MARKYYVNTPNVLGGFTRDEIDRIVRHDIKATPVGPIIVYCECQLTNCFDPYSYLIVYSEATQRLLMPRIQERPKGRRFVRLNELGKMITLDLNTLDYERGLYVPKEDEDETLE